MGKKRIVFIEEPDPMEDLGMAVGTSCGGCIGSLIVLFVGYWFVMAAFTTVMFVIAGILWAIVIVTS